MIHTNVTKREVTIVVVFVTTSVHGYCCCRVAWSKAGRRTRSVRAKGGGGIYGISKAVERCSQSDLFLPFHSAAGL